MEFIDDTPVTMNNDAGKKMTPKTVRVEDRLLEIAKKRIGDNGANDFSDYVRGLLIADAMSAAEVSLSGIDIPGWLVGKRLEFSIIDPDPIMPANAAPKKGRKAG